MPNWAELHELHSTEKAQHGQVDYRRGTEKEHCGNCRNFIPACFVNRCLSVVCPIEPEMWCRRWKAN